VTRRVRVRPLAEDDLANVWAYIATDDVDMADQFIDLLTSKFDMIANQPGIGKACPELAEDLRRNVVGNYLIFYSPDKNGIVIERVLHGARNLDLIF